MPLEFEGELIEVPYAHLGLVCPRSDDMMAVARTLDTVACFWELEVLYELYGALDVFTNRALSLGFGRTFPYKKIWQGGGRARGGAIDCVNFDRVCVHASNQSFSAQCDAWIGSVTVKPDESLGVSPFI